MNPFHFSTFKQSLKAGVPPEGKQASPDETVRKVINPNTQTHTDTQREGERAGPEPAGEPERVEAVGRTGDDC